MRRPPDSVALVARTHWLVGTIVFVSVAVLHLLTLRLQNIAFSPRTYEITLGLGTLYLVGGTVVWFGLPLGRALSELCGALYFVRPRLGERIFRIMRSEEFKAHFRRRPKPEGVAPALPEEQKDSGDKSTE